jgi:CRP-like cAMP-binding protein
MSNAFIDKLCGFVPLSEDDTAALENACVPQRDTPPRYDIIREGDNPTSVIVMLEGWSCRYKMLADGGRQITAFLMPGDFSEMDATILDKMDHSIATLTQARVAMISREKMEELTKVRPAVTHALRLAQQVDEGVLRAWIVSMGRRNSIQRVAHLLCELSVRAQSIGLATAERCELPISQIVLADALGLTPVHINRVLSTLRLHGAMERHARLLVITDTLKLIEVAGFDENYLHRRLKYAA